MDDDIDAFYRGRQVIILSDVAPYNLYPTTHLTGLFFIGFCLDIEASDLMALLKQPPGGIRAEITECAGYQHFHLDLRFIVLRDTVLTLRLRFLCFIIWGFAQYELSDKRL